MPEKSLWGTRLLVVDDNLATRELLTQSLRRMHFDVDAVSNGAAAVEAIAHMDTQRRPYRLVVMDWLMPELDGVESSRIIRALPLSERPEIVLVTAAAPKDLEAQIGEGDFEIVLPKPVATAQLFQAVVQQLQAARRAQGPQPSDTDALAQARAELSGARVLLVEGHEVNRLVGTELLQLAGLHVDVAADVEQAASMASATAYQLMLVDMSEVGTEVAALTGRLRAQSRQPQVPIVLMTARPHGLDRARCNAAGVQDILFKPVEPMLLARTLLRWIRPSGAAPQMEGLDIEGLQWRDGLRRCGGKPDFYRSMLGQFVQRWKNSGQQVSALLEQSQWEDAARLVHSLKGVAGNLGATQVQAAAMELEPQLSALREQRDPASLERAADALARLQSQLSPLMERLERALSAIGTAEASPRQAAVPPEELQALALRLGEMLELGDVGLMPLMEEKAAAMRQLLGARHRDFERAVRRYDFDAARRLLDGQDGDG